MGFPLPPTQCLQCRHLFWNMRRDDPALIPFVKDPRAEPSARADEVIHACAAFPDGIPAAGRDDTFTHNRPLPGDHGLQYSPLP